MSFVAHSRRASLPSLLAAAESGEARICQFAARLLVVAPLALDAVGVPFDATPETRRLGRVLRGAAVDVAGVTVVPPEWEERAAELRLRRLAHLGAGGRDGAASARLSHAEQSTA